MFKSQRTQLAIDLVNRITIDNPKKVLDIGCGPGNSTNVLAQRFKGSYILGIDNSSNMIETVKNQYSNIDFNICDASKKLSGFDKDFDIVFSNACIQWISNHYKLLKDMMQLIKPGGILAVQIPMNYKEPIQKIINQVSSSEKWRSEFSSNRIFYNLTQSEYWIYYLKYHQNFLYGKLHTVIF
ncbi:methyltransferase domain-containing protein [Clostridium bornimense]|uniref:methyltransferase domain-containing protein n=1 Tax=Clostridium bornimense TaxID=1216932 RepID=UPI001C117EA1|nr:methyltransferase domain-containing protein [Clostridium bornimense]MBU5317310.1 methyltransferase domain-containing protein [Clostridium bornimense]